MNNLIEKISKQLKEQCPEVEFKINNDEMTILPKDKNGFEIFIQQAERENTIHFGSWHFHFENEKEGEIELFNYLGFGMSKLGRLKTYSRSGEEYKWTFEIKNEEDDEWYSAGTMALMNFKFWEKPIVKYYQNNLIELEEKKE
ncbi:hypothetical protein [Aureibacter tunicatorum]|uniref:Uncharacterized protein n=1 Tax=Aureibacter tunicatorum TaxID=866807 RepID=A0AAE4BUU2_9BACT|nr:hypothetical protein [Aureibacter tunicatorum]MDR6241123.1 hypothetical protein [Aureibacter tunicatorum]BDD03901.1 hypothetical protein AUTU_13840 [Aureibacter tunicatorum]